MASIQTFEVTVKHAAHFSSRSEPWNYRACQPPAPATDRIYRPPTDIRSLRCGPLRSRFRSDPVGMSRCPRAAAPPSSVMNSRRRMCALKSRDRTYHIVDAKNALCVTAKLIGQCRRWVINGPAGLEIRLPFYPRDRTSPTKPAMSVSCHEQTCRQCNYLRSRQSLCRCR